MLLAMVLQASFVHEPMESYRTSTIRGFTVHVSAAAVANPTFTNPALKTLDDQLKKVIDVVPASTLPSLRSIPIFVENMNPGFPCACYHPGAGWLKENGYLLKKENSVEISNTQNFVKWVEQQPFMILHELAHGYHDIEFTYDDPYITKAWENAKKQGFLEKVVRYNGKVERHYALNNPMEYFAEATEAYFGKNDYYPFNREELRKVDPKALEMVEWAWKVKRAQR